MAIVRERLEAPNHFVAIGEIGLDLYWDKTFLNEQLYVVETTDRVGARIQFADCDAFAGSIRLYI